MPIYTQTTAHSFLRMVDPRHGLALDDPDRMSAHISKSFDLEPVPWRWHLLAGAEGTLSLHTI